MQFEPSVYPPFPSTGGYAYASPPPTGMPPRVHAFYEGGYGVPTPAPSPRTPSSRRRSSTADHMGNPDYSGGKRPSSSRRHGSGLGGHPEFPLEQPYHPATSPRPSHGHPTFMHTPLHTPPPSAHAQHPPMPNIYSYVPGYASPQQPEYVSYPEGVRYTYDPRFYFPVQYLRNTRRARFRYGANDGGKQFSYTPAPGPQSPPPNIGRRSQSRSHHRTSTWSGENSPRSPPRSSKPTSPQPTQPASHGSPRPDADPKLDEQAKRTKATALGIPVDFSLKNWDPEEEPIILLGSVFDANSLGEWIFNWTKYHHGRQHEATRTAGGLWELLIELSSKLKRANEFKDQIRLSDNRDTVMDFVESGDRLWNKLKELLKACEQYMWSGARRVGSPQHAEGKSKVQMGRKSGAEFVDAMFNGEKEWETTKRLMTGIAMWCKRFEVNCEDILKDPTA